MNIRPNNTVSRTDSSLISSGAVRPTSGPVGYSGNSKSVRILYLSVIAAIIIIIFYISVNRLEYYSIAMRILGAGSAIGTGSSNNLFDSVIFRGLPLRFGFTVGDGNIAYIFNYALISRGMGTSGYRV